MKRTILILLTALLSTAPLLAQYSPCYEAAFAEGKRLYNAGKYAQAKAYFIEAKGCPDPNEADADKWLGMCDKAIAKTSQTSQATSKKPKTQKSNGSGNDDNWLSPTQQKKKFGDNLYQGYGKWGYFGRGGKMKIDYRFDEARHFHEDFAAVELYDRGWGFIDKTGKYIVEPCFNEVGDFYEGRARVRVLLGWSFHTKDTVYEVRHDFDAKYNGKYGFIDEKGEFVVTPQYEEADNFYQGLAAVKTNGKWGFIDKNGEMVIQPEFEKARGFWSDQGLAQVQLDGKWGYVDKSGNLAIEPQYDEVYNRSGGLADINKDGKWGCVDLKTKKIVIEPQYDVRIWSFGEDGLAGVKLDGKWGFIDKSYKIVIEPQFYQVHEDFYRGKATVVTMDKKWARINTSGKIVKWL